MRRKMLSVALAAAVLAAPSALAKGPFGLIQVGPWRGGAHTDNQTGAFSSCMADARYKNGITVYVRVDASVQWDLAFSNDAWTFQAGEFPVDLTFDGQRAIRVVARAAGANLVHVPMPHDSEVVRQFRKSRVMSLFIEGRLFQLSLGNTDELMRTIGNCVARMVKHGIGSAGDFSVRPGAAASARKSAATIGPVSNSSAERRAPGPDLQIEAIELASNFILKSALRNARVLSRSETPVGFASTGAAWASEEATGLVRIIPPKPGMKGIDVAAAVAAADAKHCQGKFASGRVSELVDSEVVFRGFATCEDSKGGRFSQYFIVPRRKGGFVLFSVISSATTEGGSSVTKEEKLSEFRRAALTVTQ